MNKKVEAIIREAQKSGTTKGLGLGYNQITEIPESLGNLTNLTGLDLGRNQITEIPESLGNLTNLTIYR